MKPLKKSEGWGGVSTVTEVELNLSDAKMRSLLEKVQEVKNTGNDEMRKTRADRLCAWIHANVIFLPAGGLVQFKILTPNCGSVKYVNGNVNIELFKQVCNALRELNTCLCQYTATQQLVGEFNVIRKDLKKKDPRAFNASSAEDIPSVIGLPHSMDDVD